MGCQLRGIACKGRKEFSQSQLVLFTLQVFPVWQILVLITFRILLLATPTAAQRVLTKQMLRYGQECRLKAWGIVFVLVECVCIILLDNLDDLLTKLVM